MKTLMMLGILANIFAGQVVMAANETTFCRASTKWTVLINPEAKKVEVSAWGKIVDTFTIQDTEYRFIEVIPGVLQTTYILEDGYEVVTEFKKMNRGEGYEKTGKGFALKDGKEAANYTYCSRILQ